MDAHNTHPLSHTLLAQWIFESARRHGDKPYVHSIAQNATLTYADLHAATARLGNYLAARGLGANDRVALLSNNSIEHLIAYLGVMAHGATICTIHLEANASHLDSILAALEPRLVLYEDGHGLEARATHAAPGLWQRLGHWRPDSQTSASDGLFADLASSVPVPEGAPVVRARPDHDACICFTSGTSATPKGVMLTFAELLGNAPATADAFGMTADDRILDYRSFNWASAQILGCLAPLTKGATLILGTKFSQSRFFDWVRDHRATIATGNPTVINMLMAGDARDTHADLPTLRFMTSSSAPLLQEEWKRFEERFAIPVIQGYGASEAGWIAGADETTRRFGSVGRPLPYHRLCIVAEDGTPLPTGEIGLVDLGDDPARAYRYLASDGEAHVNATGRLRTGDFGYLDPDGYLFVTGRQKDLIIRGGVNISPLEIDATVIELGQVAEVATVGVPDPIYGEAVVTFIVRLPGTALSEDALRAHCENRLPAFKVPKEFHIRDSLPKTDRGKLDRKALVADWMAARATSQGPG